MAAPMTKLLFLFLLGVTSWSRYVAAYQIKMLSASAEVFPENEVIDSFETRIYGDILRSTVNVVDCARIKEVDAVPTNFADYVGTSKPSATCNPFKDFSCKDKGTYEFDCGIPSLGIDLPPGSYAVEVMYQTTNGPVAKTNTEFTVTE